MADSALLKIDRAAKHVGELSELFRKSRPFALVLETDTIARQRTISPKENEAVVAEAGLIAGDVVHNIRSALDHAYWEIVSPLCTNDGELKRLQFPFAEEASGYDAALHQRLAQRAGTGFYCGLRILRSHGDVDGNEPLAMIHKMDILDKHKLLIPTSDYMKLPRDLIKGLVPDFRFPIAEGTAFSNCQWVWNYRGSFPDSQIGELKAPTLSVFERELDIPLDVVFSVWPSGLPRPVIPTLTELVDAARKTIVLMREAAQSC